MITLLHTQQKHDYVYVINLKVNKPLNKKYFYFLGKYQALLDYLYKATLI